MHEQERLEMIEHCKHYAHELDLASQRGLPGVDTSTAVIVTAELLRQLADILEGADCLDTDRQDGAWDAAAKRWKEGKDR